MAFQPTIDDMLTIRGNIYRIAAHPASPGSPYAIQGRQSVVYQLINSETNERERHALKVFEPRYRTPVLASTNDRFLALADLPGLSVCRREILNASQDSELLRQYPDLSYAVWMPWIDGLTWMETMLDATKLAPEDSLKLARALAEVLTGMEERGLAHCDLTGGNVIVSAAGSSTDHPVELVDVEQIYSPQLGQPPELIAPVPGYAYRKGKARWRADADRFAGATLLSEMLGWCDERVRALAWGEHYFDPREIQQETERYQVLRRVIRERWGKSAAAMLKRAWRSETLSDCPTFLEWLSILPETPAEIEAFERADAEESMSLPGEKDAAIRALMSLVKQLKDDGNIPGALAACRQAQALTTGNESLRIELGRMIELLESQVEQSQVVRPPIVDTRISQGTPSTQDLAAIAPVGAPSAESPERSDIWQSPVAVQEEPVKESVPGGPAEIPGQEQGMEAAEARIAPPVIEEGRTAALPLEAYPTGPEPSPEAKREGRSCLSWLSLLILGIVAGIAVYYFVFMQHNQQVTDLLSRVIGRQPVATVPAVERREAAPEVTAGPAAPEFPPAPMGGQPPEGQPGAPDMPPPGQKPVSAPEGQPGAPDMPPPGQKPVSAPEGQPGAPDMLPPGEKATTVPGPKPTRESKPSLGATEVAATAPAVSQKATPTAPTTVPPAVSGDIKPGQSNTRQADDMAMVAVPGGEFRMGITEEQVKDVLQLCREYSGNCDSDWFSAEQPAHPVSLEPFWIDKTEVTNAQFARFLNDQDQQALKNLATWIDLDNGSSQIERSADQYQPKTGLDEHPVSLVSWEGAQAYCKWAGARLATEAEWEYAARGPDSRIFPWGNEFDDSRLNYISSSDGYAETAPVGSFLSGGSWCGALDMSGNVAEWTADWHGLYKDEVQKDPQGPALGQYKVNKGGSFQSQPYETRGAGRGAGSPTDTNRMFGFRCAVSP